MHPLFCVVSTFNFVRFTVFYSGAGACVMTTTANGLKRMDGKHLNKILLSFRICAQKYI